MVFVDSNIFISIWDKDNVNHKIAVSKSKQLEEENETIVLSNIVVYEVATVLSMRVSQTIAKRFLETVEKGDFEVIFINNELDRMAKEIFANLGDKNVGLFDCTSFAIIEKYKIDKVFSFDKDFVKYGKNLGWQFV